MSKHLKKLLPSSASRVKIKPEEGIILDESQQNDENYPSQNSFSILEKSNFHSPSVILNTTALNYYIEEMFKNEKDFLLILSPYINIAKKLKTILSMSNAKITIIYRKENNEEKEKKNKDNLKDLIDYLPNVSFLQAYNLHAKVYISSKYFIVSSLNLYDFSQINNFELGILINNENENDLANQLKNEIRILFKENDFNLSILEFFNKKYKILDIYRYLKTQCGITSINDKKFNELNNYIANELKKNKNLKEKESEPFSYATKITKEMYDYGIENIKLPI